MAELGHIFPDNEAKLVIEVGNSIKKADEALLKYSQDAEKLINILKEHGLSLDQLNKAQKKAEETTIRIVKVNNDLQKNESSLKRIEQERLKIKEQQRKVLTKNLVAEEKSNVILQKGKMALQQKNAEIKRNIIITTSQEGAYNKINASLNKNITRWKSLSQSERENTKEGKELLRTIQKQDAELKKLDTQIGRSQRNVGNYGSALKGVARNLIGAFGVVGGVAAFASVLKNAFATVNNFTKAQSELIALSGKSREELSGLTEQAKQLGGVTEFTATQVTKLQTELIKLGFATSEIELSTRAILNFASATGAELPDAAKTAGTALRVFGLDASRMDEVVASLAVSTTKSALTFEHFDTILSTAGPVAKAYGFTLQDTIALTGKLTDAGFDASKGSTALRNILLNLADTNGKLAKELGGNINNFDELIPALIELRKRGVSLNTTLELTDKRSVAAFNQFLNTAESAKVLRDGISDVNDELQEMVDKKLDNMAGDITKLSSAWEGFVLKGESGVNVFRETLQFVNDLIIKLSNIDLIFKRTRKFTEEEVARTWDVLLALNDKKAKDFQEIIKSYADTSFVDLFGNEEEFKERLDEVGFSTREAGLLWDEFLKRRNEQKQLEIKANADKLRQLEQQERNSAIRQEEEREKEAEKRREKQEKLNEGIISAFDKITEKDKKKKQESTETFEEQIDREMDLYNKSLDGEVNATIEAVDKIIAERNRQKDEFEKNQDDIEAKAIKTTDKIIDISSQVNDAIYAFASGQIDSFKDFSKQILIIALEQLKVQAQLAIAQATVTSLAQPDSVATFGASGLVRAGILTALIEAAFAGLSGIIEGFEKGTKNAPAEFVAGEKGRELMKLRSGEIMMVDSATHFKGSRYKGATIYNNSETEKIIAESNKMGLTSFDTTELRDEMRAVRKAITNKPVMITDNSGRVIGKSSPGYRETYLNRLRNGR